MRPFDPDEKERKKGRKKVKEVEVNVHDLA